MTARKVSICCPFMAIHSENDLTGVRPTGFKCGINQWFQGAASRVHDTVAQVFSRIDHKFDQMCAKQEGEFSEIAVLEINYEEVGVEDRNYY